MLQLLVVLAKRVAVLRSTELCHVSLLIVANDSMWWHFSVLKATEHAAYIACLSCSNTSAAQYAYIV